MKNLKFILRRITIEPIKFILISLLFVILHSSSFSQIVNGDFENNPPDGWESVNGSYIDKDAGGVNSIGIISPSRGVIIQKSPLIRASALLQTFDCPGPPPKKCYIKFSYKFDNNPLGTSSDVSVNGSSTNLPPTVGAGFTTVQVQTNCGMVTIQFSSISAGDGGPKAVFEIDNVVAKCDTIGYPGLTSLNTTPISPGSGIALLVSTPSYPPPSKCPYPGNCVPPLGGLYYGDFIQNYDGASISNMTLGQFLNCNVLPANVGDSSLSTINAQFKASLVIGTSPSVSIVSPALVVIKLKKVSQVLGVSKYVSELVQLDVIGGNLPPGVMLRETPTITSGGIVTSEASSGGYLISSNFDIITDITLDGGLMWTTASQSGYVALLCISDIPTLSEWSLIILLLLFAAFAMRFMYQRQAVALLGNNVNMSIVKKINPPLFFKMASYSLSMALGLLLLAYFYFKEIGLLDIFGTLTAASIVTYMFYMFFEQKNNNH